MIARENERGLEINVLMGSKPLGMSRKQWRIIYRSGVRFSRDEFSI